MSTNPTYLEAKAKMEAWCAYQERCQYEVSNKLRQMGLKQDLIDSLIFELISNRFIDEERFAEAYVSGKFRIKRWGKIKIKQHLKAKFISSYSIEKALKTIDKSEYYATIQHLIQKKTQALPPQVNDYVLKAKVFQYLQSKGYDFGDIELMWGDFA